MCGLHAIELSNWDTIFETIRDRYVDRATFAERMRKAAEFCLCFCYESEVLNDLYIAFMYTNLVLVECMKGDARYAAWQRTGELCDALVAMGLHQIRSSPETPFFLAELRKKIFCSSYSRDKVTATFLGRPPRLSYRYCKMVSRTWLMASDSRSLYHQVMPLDLSDEQIFMEGADLQEALNTLDSQGWNQTGNLNRATWTRVWFQHCQVREDILELALGPETEDISHRAKQIWQKLKTMHTSYVQRTHRITSRVQGVNLLFDLDTPTS